MQMLVQPQYQPMAVEDQVMQIYLAVKGYLMPIKVEDVAEFEEKIHQVHACSVSRCGQPH